MKEWFTKHTDMIIVLTAIISSMIWMNAKFNNIDQRFANIDLKFAHTEAYIDKRFSDLEKEMAIIKTVLIMKNIMPAELAIKEREIE